MFKRFFKRDKEEKDFEKNIKEDINEEITEQASLEKEPKKKLSLLERFKKGLKKTRDSITSKIDDIILKYKKIDEQLFMDLEEILISADIGVNTTMELMSTLEEKVKRENIEDPSLIKNVLKDIMNEKLVEKNFDKEIDLSTQTVILVVGVNGVGKTTSIGKLAHLFKSEGKSVILAAADTFRAAAIDQLKEWAKRANVDIISHSEGADPSAVVFDAIASAKAKKKDVLIVDTAGRLHNKKNLMNELNKIFRVIEKNYPQAKREVLLVLDGTTGQNAMYQAREFKEVCDLTGVILTKLDGTAKGGIVFPLQLELNIPVKFIGIGEQMDNLEKYDNKDFIEAIFG